MVFARHKPFVNHLELKLPNGPPDLFTCESDYVDSFSDVFGPTPIEASIGNLVVATSSSGKVCNDYPSVIHIRSHSLHSSGAYIDPSSVRSKLTLHETGDALELFAEKEYREAKEELEYSVNDDAVKENNLESNDCCMNYQSIGVEDFEVLKVVGQGAFGKVYQVRRTGTSEIYAMKVMHKDKIVQKNHAEYIKSERDILTKVVHPFIVRLRYSFQTKYRLYLVLDFVNGGHVFFHLYRQGLFREDLARFYAGEIVCAVSHLHANGIMHRDLKPENILLDADGHPPFTGGNRQKIQQKIIKDKLKLPAFLSSEAHSLLKGLLQKDARKRLGSGDRGSEEIKSHKWFKSVNWKKLEAREIRPSFVPEVSGKHCVANFEERWTNMPLLDSPAASPKKDDNTFKKFSFIGTPSLCLVGDA
ncbi:serine/threonine-protein kinase AtPK2/AtPK19 isoform X2 [Arachis ipaensis]|uniref:serine/threonine-protein kinase AtPK2/AtPK19 isoform X2 n=1 Tax=Arachis ipaensis TaxID=130454 RepID=UPI000A2B2F3B|nr:serine/threonine-protein kinase AtPK2/AtPK19 isoform X2 [Arachis ipaensis]XP_025667682.1 serine/threonine-protein kinase AtPK2/AtPK19 isoform X3 [Arachis hypogaea]